MPNNIVNILRVNGSEEQVKHLFDSIKGDFSVIDFNKIIPMLDEVKGDGYDYCSWARENWGTKWNAYHDDVIDDNTIKFETAWNGIPELIGVLSESGLS